jgi:hypothetical protein
MTDSTEMSDPYRSPAYPMDQEDLPRRPGYRRPGGLTAICVIAIVAGIVGILLVLMGALGFVVSLALQGNFPTGSTTSEAHRLTQEMNEEVHALALYFVIPNILVYLIDSAVAVSLLVGGVKGLKLKPHARRLLLVTFCGALIFELLRTPYYLYQQMLFSGIQNEYWPKIFAAQSGPVAFDGEAMASFMSIVGYVMIVVFLLMKGGFYAVGATYVSRPKIKQLFDERQRSSI